MRLFLMLCGLFLAQPALATVCVDTPLSAQIHAAHIVFVATVNGAEGDLPFDDLKNGDEYRVDYSYSLRQTLKGDPRLVPLLYTVNIYHAYNADIEISGPETRLLPGDNVLVVAGEAGPAQVGECTPSRLWEPEMLKLLDSRRSSNSSFDPKPLRGSA